MRRKKNIIDDIALRMRFEEVTDDEIITLISENVCATGKLPLISTLAQSPFSDNASREIVWRICQSAILPLQV